jgi:hypothetical protein
MFRTSDILLLTVKFDMFACSVYMALLQDSCRPVMTIYKLVTMDAPIWGLGERLEDCLIAVDRLLS